MGQPSLQDAADQLTGFIQRLAPLQVVADALKNIASLDNAVAEKQKALDAASTSLDSTMESVGKAKSSLAKLQDAIQAQADSANKDVEQTLAAAKDSAAKTLAEAKASAKAITDLARADADKIVDAANSSLVGLEAKAAAKAAEFDSLVASTKRAQAELDDITAKVAALKSMINGTAQSN
jgi:chromosome segregation ATPase